MQTVKMFIAGLGTIYNEKSETKLLLLEQWLTQHIPEQALAQLYDEIMRNHREYMPTPAIIRDYYDRITGNTPERAWFTVLVAMSEVGRYHSVRFEDPRIPETIRLVWGNWPGLCADEQSTNWIRNAFLKTYQTTVEGAGYEKHLEGLMEMRNGVFETRLISNQGRCVKAIPGRPKAKGESLKISEGNRV